MRKIVRDSGVIFVLIFASELCIFSHLKKPEKRRDATPLATTKRLYYCHSETRSAEQSYLRNVLQVALLIQS